MEATVILYYDYDSFMTQLLLFDVISQLHFCGFEVVAVVSDMGPTNIRLWKSLGITPTKTFSHPISEKQIYMFADVPHLMKLVWNHFIDSGFVLPNNKYIGKQRQNVKLATQILSNSMANAISYLGQKHLLQYNNWKE
ncbi:Uncharacterized protein FWK35_00033891, partial [Aphis craccivora]